MEQTSAKKAASEHLKADKTAILSEMYADAELERCCIAEPSVTLSRMS